LASEQTGRYDEEKNVADDKNRTLVYSRPESKRHTDFA